MEAKDTVMTNMKISRVAYQRNLIFTENSLLASTRKPDADRCIAKAQAEVSFKAGIKEVVDSFDEVQILSTPDNERRAFERILKYWQTEKEKSKS